MENPYTTSTSSTDEIVELTLVTSGEQTVLACEKAEAVIIDNLGGRHVRTHTRYISGDGGRVITDATSTYACACGKHLLTKESVAFCEACQAAACRIHLKTADDGATLAKLCASCYEHGKGQRAVLRWARRTLRFIEWLTNI
jgi:hypothetical protein